LEEPDFADLSPDRNQSDELEFALFGSKLDEQALSNLRRDIETQQNQRARAEQVLTDVRREVERMEQQIEQEASQKEELQVVVDDLHQQIQALILELRQEKERREREIKIISEANYTSSEEEMGVSPSSYNVLNQRFSDKEDVAIYLNMVGVSSRGQSAKRTDEKFEKEPSVTQISNPP